MMGKRQFRHRQGGRQNRLIRLRMQTVFQT